LGALMGRNGYCCALARAANNKPRMQMQQRRTPYPADLFAADAIVISARVASQVSLYP
jgi:hypothetical protein